LSLYKNKLKAKHITDICFKFDTDFLGSSARAAYATQCMFDEYVKNVFLALKNLYHHVGSGYNLAYRCRQKVDKGLVRLS